LFLTKHARGDWGNVSPEDAALNDAAVRDGSRILSVYRTLKGTKLWVITEAEGVGGRRREPPAAGEPRPVQRGVAGPEKQPVAT
jgi:hypothetical protein